MKGRSLANWVPQGDIQFISMTQEFTRFRKKLEAEAGKPIYELEVNAAALLSDLVVFLHFGERQHSVILGPDAANYLAALLSERVIARTQH